MAYFIETHDVYKALTDDVQILVMEEWDAKVFADWLHSIFGDVLWDDWTYEDTVKMPPPSARYFTWTVLGDERSVQIFTF